MLSAQNERRPKAFVFNQLDWQNASNPSSKSSKIVQAGRPITGEASAIAEVLLFEDKGAKRTLRTRRNVSKQPRRSPVSSSEALFKLELLILRVSISFKTSGSACLERSSPQRTMNCWLLRPSTQICRMPPDSPSNRRQLKFARD